MICKKKQKMKILKCHTIFDHDQQYFCDYGVGTVIEPKVPFYVVSCFLS